MSNNWLAEDLTKERKGRSKKSRVKLSFGLVGLIGAVIILVVLSTQPIKKISNVSSTSSGVPSNSTSTAAPSDSASNSDLSGLIQKAQDAAKQALASGNAAMYAAEQNQLKVLQNEQAGAAYFNANAGAASTTPSTSTYTPSPETTPTPAAQCQYSSEITTLYANILALENTKPQPQDNNYGTPPGVYAGELASWAANTNLRFSNMQALLNQYLSSPGC
jgi:hypothetical protein